MAEFQVKSLDDAEAKSQQEVEATLLKEDQETATPTETSEVVVNDTTNEVKVESSPVSTESATTEEVAETPEEVVDPLNENSVLSYINEKYDREVSSIDELFKAEEKGIDLPEDVEAFLKFKNDTGRGLNDYVKLNTNYDELDPDKVLAEFWRQTQPHLDEEDIAFELENKFGFDPEYDDERDGKKRTIAKKQELSKAKKHCENLKKDYLVPLEARGQDLSEEDSKSYEAYKKYAEDSKSQQEYTQKRQEYFANKTNELFTNEFKGFEFQLADDKNVVYKPASGDQMRKSQANLEGFVNKHINKDGFVNDVGNYHRSLAVAMNPEGFAKFFYEQGKADAIDNVTKETKNIDMTNVRSAPESVNSGGFKVTNLSNEKMGSRLVIRSNK